MPPRFLGPRSLMWPCRLREAVRQHGYAESGLSMPVAFMTRVGSGYVFSLCCLRQPCLPPHSLATSLTGCYCTVKERKKNGDGESVPYATPE